MADVQQINCLGHRTHDGDDGDGDADAWYQKYDGNIDDGGDDNDDAIDADDSDAGHDYMLVMCMVLKSDGLQNQSSQLANKQTN